MEKSSKKKVAKKTAKKKRKPGPVPSENPRLSVHWRVREETLKRLGERAKADRRTANDLAEIFIEKGLGILYDDKFNIIH